MLLFYYLVCRWILIYIGLLQEFFITTHLHEHLWKQMISRYMVYKDFPREQPKSLHSTQQLFSHNKENAHTWRQFRRNFKRRATAASTADASNLMIIPENWRTCPEHLHSVFTVLHSCISPMYFSYSKSVGNNWGISLKRPTLVWW